MMKKFNKAYPSIAFTFLLFSIAPSVYAGCGERETSAWSVNTVTGEKRTIGKGMFRECGNISGAFSGFSSGNFYAGSAVCLSNCESGFKPKATYVKVIDVWKPGTKSESGNATCVQQSGDVTKFCWAN